MEINKKIDSFIQLGEFLSSFSSDNINSEWDRRLNEIVQNDHIYNPWFTPENVLNAIHAIGESLSAEKLHRWLNIYPSVYKEKNKKKIAVITAGNIPLVGFHDFICVLLSGHIFLGKLSSKDNRLLKFISEYLIDLNKDFRDLIFFTEEKLEKFDAVIATGSNNSARYFEYYFGKYPHIIRKNRNSLAILTGFESNEDIKALGIDIFSYFGLGCLNVSKLFVPKDYCFDQFFENIQHFNSLYHHNKYANNYDYNKSVYLMNQIQHFDNGFLIAREDLSLSSPIGVLFYQYYEKLDSVKEFIQINDNQIQCVVSGSEQIVNAIPFGKAQQPELWDYADNVDTMQFLLDLN